MSGVSYGGSMIQSGVMGSCFTIVDNLKFVDTCQGGGTFL